MPEETKGPCRESDDLLTTGDMARLSQTTLRTVRFYEAEGLISAQAREDGCQRRFPREELIKLQTIADLREAGLSLHDIKDLITLKQRSGCANAPEAAERLAVALDQRLCELEQRAQTLARVQQELLAMKQSLAICRECTKPAFPAGCRGCEHTQAPLAERPNTLLWKQ